MNRPEFTEKHVKINTLIDCNKFILLKLLLTDNGQLMLDNLTELRKKGKGDSLKGRKLSNDIEKLLNNVQDAVGTAITNYETSEITQKPSTNTGQQQARLLQEPDQPDSGSLEQGIVRWIDSIFS